MDYINESGKKNMCLEIRIDVEGDLVVELEVFWNSRTLKSIMQNSMA